MKQADFEPRRGAVNVLVGENGAGKSTLMKIIAVVERPTAGRILLDGEAVVFSGGADAMKRGIGMVFQELNFFGNLSVAENVRRSQPAHDPGCLALPRVRKISPQNLWSAGAEKSLASDPIICRTIHTSTFFRDSRPVTRPSRRTVMKSPIRTSSSSRCEI